MRVILEAFCREYLFPAPRCWFKSGHGNRAHSFQGFFRDLLSFLSLCKWPLLYSRSGYLCSTSSHVWPLLCIASPSLYDLNVWPILCMAPLSIICNAPALLEECTSLSFPMPRSQHDPKVALTVSLCCVTLCTCGIRRIEGGHTSGTPSAVMYHHPRLVLGVFAGKSASGRHYTTMLLAC